MATRPDIDKTRPKRLGRSSVTGHFVLKPVSKRNPRLSKPSDKPSPSVQT